MTDKNEKSEIWIAAIDSQWQTQGYVLLSNEKVLVALLLVEI